MPGESRKSRKFDRVTQNPEAVSQTKRFIMNKWYAYIIIICNVHQNVYKLTEKQDKFTNTMILLIACFVSKNFERQKEKEEEEEIALDSCNLF